MFFLHSQKKWIVTIIIGFGIGGFGNLFLNILFPELNITEVAYAGEKSKLIVDNKLNINGVLNNDFKFLFDYKRFRLGAEYFLNTNGNDNESFFARIPFWKKANLHLYLDENGHEGRLIINPNKNFTIITGVFKNNGSKINFYEALTFMNKSLGSKNNMGGGIEIRNTDKKYELGAYGFIKLKGFIAGYGKYPMNQKHIVIGKPGNNSFALRYLRIEKENGFNLDNILITPCEIGVADIDFILPLKDYVLCAPCSIAIPRTNPNRFDNYDINSRGKNWIINFTRTNTLNKKVINAEFIKYLNKNLWIGGGYYRLRGKISDDQIRIEFGYTPASFYQLKKEDILSLRVVLGYSTKTGNKSVAMRLISILL